METGASAIRGGRTLEQGAVVSPAWRSSSISLPNSIAVTFIGSTSGKLTRFTTNSPVRRILPPVSLASPGARPPMPKHTTGGSPETQLKNENGAAFTEPSRSCVVTQAIGRGTMVEIRSL